MNIHQILTLTAVDSGHNTNSTTTSAQVSYNQSDIDIQFEGVTVEIITKEVSECVGMQNTVDLKKAAAHASPSEAL